MYCFVMRTEERVGEERTEEERRGQKRGGEELDQSKRIWGKI